MIYFAAGAFAGVVHCLVSTKMSLMAESGASRVAQALALAAVLGGVGYGAIIWFVSWLLF